MSNHQWKQLALGIVALGFAAQASAAGFITKIEPSKKSATLEGGKAVVNFTVTDSADDTDTCGIWIDYGDGGSPDTRIITKADGLFPRSLEHSFNKAGGFSIKAKGQRVKTTLGCNGEAETFVTISAPVAAAKAPAKAAAAAPACPDGWQLEAKSYNKTTGAFACGAGAPSSKLACGPGLAYYEKAGVIGCRKGK